MPYTVKRRETMETYRNEEQMQCLAKSEGCSVFRMENATGEGTIAMYELFPGVMLGFNDFHMDYFDSEFVPQKHVFCIDHCREGRMQYVADEDAYAYVEAGDLKLDRRLTHTGHFEFPLAHYHGAMICFDLETADAGLAAQMKGFPVSAAAICRKFCEGKYPRVLHGHPMVDHIFGELYAVPEQIRIPYFKLKVMELLLFLEAAELPRRIDEPAYFYRTQVEKVKAIGHYLTEHMDENITQRELSERFDIPQTGMKQCFKSVYGTSIGDWLLKYRMIRAAVLLREDREKNVAEIARMVGYDSPSKFAMAFKRVMQMSPVEYRNAIR